MSDAEGSASEQSTRKPSATSAPTEQPSTTSARPEEVVPHWRIPHYQPAARHIRDWHYGSRRNK